MTLREEALKLADDIDEYAPNTNIADVIRRLVAEVDRLNGKTLHEADFVKNAKLRLEANEE